MENVQHIFAQSSRLILRKFSMCDVEPSYFYRSNPQVAELQSWENYQYHKTESFVKERSLRVPDQPGTWFQFTIALAETNYLIGNCAFHTLLDEP